MNERFNLPSGLQTVGESFAENLFYNCSGDKFTMNDVINLPSGIQTVGEAFADYMFNNCSGKNFTMNQVFNLPSGIKDASSNFAYGMFQDCSGDNFTMNAVFNLPSGITTTERNFAQYMFRKCSGARFTMNDVFNLPQNITSTGDYFASYMFYQCEGKSFVVNNQFKFPNINKLSGTMNYSFYNMFYKVAVPQSRTAISIINGNAAPTSKCYTFNDAFSDYKYLNVNWGGLGESIPSYCIVVSPAGKNFQDAEVGYSQVDPMNFTITNIGTGAISNLKASLQDGSNFKIVSPPATSLINSKSTTFQCEPISDLDVGIYTDTVVIKGSSISQLTMDLSLRVMPSVADEPEITTQPQDIKLPLSSRASLSVTASAPSIDESYLSYQWYKSDENGNGEIIKNATASTYSMTGSTLGKNYFYVVVTNSFGIKPSQITSNVVEIDVVPKNAVEPQITTEPLDQKLAKGEECSLTVEALATDTDESYLSYQWYQGKQVADAQAIQGATTKNYKPSTKELGNYYYFVVVTNHNGIETSQTSSSPAEVAVVPNEAAPLIISQQPDNQQVYQNETATLSVEATADNEDDTYISYQWYKTSEPDSESGEVIENATDKTFQPSTAESGKYYYYVMVKNSYGINAAFAKSDIAQITVIPAIAAEPQITLQPQSRSIMLNGTCTLSVEVTADDTDDSSFSYQWYRNSEETTTGEAIENAVNSTYSPETDTVGTFYYYVIVTNSNGKQAKTVTSQIAAITVSVESADATLTALTLKGAEGNGHAIAPAFSGDQTDYIATVPYGTEKIWLTAGLNHPKAVMTIKKGDASEVSLTDNTETELSLDIGNNTFIITVTAENGITMQSYSITVNRPDKIVITYEEGKTLKDVELPKGYTWKEEDTLVGNANNEGTLFGAVYTNMGYSIDTELLIVVEKAALSPAVPNPVNAYYGQYLKTVPLPTGFRWKDDGNTRVGEVGTRTFIAVFEPDDPVNYLSFETPVTITVSRKNGGTLSQTLSASYGQTLSQLTLPAGYRWKEPGN